MHFDLHRGNTSSISFDEVVDNSIDKAMTSHTTTVSISINLKAASPLKTHGNDMKLPP
jgi:DNA gyrase/topoisomerase IV subunit B